MQKAKETLSKIFGRGSVYAFAIAFIYLSLVYITTGVNYTKSGADNVVLVLLCPLILSMVLAGLLDPNAKLKYFDLVTRAGFVIVGAFTILCLIVNEALICIILISPLWLFLHFLGDIQENILHIVKDRAEAKNGTIT
ncbi:hypothetical protein LPB140_08815 [Sphingorhabdus lutea]|uniref:Uncharacterized protein n=2 Tax=Sphingorhabdus lutea TaxID=1913578 RepID=A0A1L3JCT4_9SPHN|nr:hypothetical protein LPB140_08815 [Sphingorhabdus lutea]